MNMTLARITSTTCIAADGGWGTELQKVGLEAGSPPDMWNVLRPEKVSEVAASYVSAGAKVILTNTLGSNRFILGRYGMEDRVAEINLRGAQISREAAGRRALVFGSMGPTGKIFITGGVTEQELADSYRTQSEALWHGGADAILIETMVDVEEMKIAARAAKECTPLPIVMSMTFGFGREKMQTMMGVTTEEAVAEMERSDAWMVGANCGIGPEAYVGICRRMRAVTSKPIWLRPNAGMPQMQGDILMFPQDPETFADFAVQLRDAGANVIGGCCGTTPAHIQRLVAKLRTRRRPARAQKQITNDE
ncbi:MAG TPA: homocysteine S-methyltransferase family protein [Acidobacteriota bacterium]|nr:homocysteine S-methyltransferase family protein [Acidobacteriota bacterium]